MLKKKPDDNPQREMPFTGHLEELRGHILRSMLYICFFSCLSWYYYDPIYDTVATPLMTAFREAGFNPHMVFLDIMEPLLFRLQVVLAASVVFSLPFIIWEIWRFVAPGLYDDERVFVKPLLPFSILLCFAGFALIYFALPLAFEFLLRFGPKPGGEGAEGAELMQHLQKYFFLLLRMMIAAGVVFQTPIVMMLLGQLELVTAAGLVRFWRHAVLACFTIAAIITPTIDPFNMSIIAVPLVGLYFMSVVLVWLIERKRARLAAREAGEQPPSETPPDDTPALPPPADTPPPAAAESTPQITAATEPTLPPPPVPAGGGAPVVDRGALGPLAAPETDDEPLTDQPSTNGETDEPTTNGELDAVDDVGGTLEEAIDEALFDPTEPQSDES